jgi:hypothetical protein
MMKRTNDSDAQIHELTGTEIGRQIDLHLKRRIQIVNQRAEMYAAALKNGGNSESPVIDDDEKAAREHAKHLLNGSSPSSLSLPPDVTLDKQLYREMRGIDLAVKILSDKNIVTQAAEAVIWSEKHAEEWRQIAHDITVAAIKLNALESRAQRFLADCPYLDSGAVRLPMVLIAHHTRSIGEIPIKDLTNAALAEGIITKTELRNAEHAE